MINKPFNYPICFPSKYHPCKQQSVQSVKMGRLKIEISIKIYTEPNRYPPCPTVSMPNRRKFDLSQFILELALPISGALHKMHPYP